MSRPLAVALSAFLVAGCAGGPPLPEVPPASRIPALEVQAAAPAAGPDVLVPLGAAYVAAARPAEAVPVLERARDLGPGDRSVLFFLGLAYEDLGRRGEAIAAYETFAAPLPSGSARDHVEGRIRLLRRAELREAVRAALRTEERLEGAAAPDASAVAVFPFLFRASDETLRPLGRAMTAMLATDLARSDRITVLERLHVQALLDEIELGERGLVDPATAARGGQVLGAGRIVQGRMESDAERIRLEAAVVSVDDPANGRPAVEQVDALERLFEMEYRLALQVFEAMGIALTAAEREQIARRPTENLQALLAFGHGLEADDGGRFAEAAEHFARAARLDPDFEQARTEEARAASMAEAAELSTAEVVEVVGATPPAEDLGVDALLEQVGPRDAVQEALGTEGLGRQDRTRRIRILFPRPGGPE